MINARRGRRKKERSGVVWCLLISTGNDSIIARARIGLVVHSQKVGLGCWSLGRVRTKDVDVLAVLVSETYIFIVGDRWTMCRAARKDSQGAMLRSEVNVHHSIFVGGSKHVVSVLQWA